MVYQRIGDHLEEREEPYLLAANSKHTRGSVGVGIK